MKTIELNICKICGKGFHYCVSCMVDPCRDEGCCSDDCWDKSEELATLKKRTLDFYNALITDEQKQFFKEVCKDIEELYLYKMSIWIKNLSNKE